MNAQKWLAGAAVAIAVAIGSVAVAPPAFAATRLGGIELGTYCQKKVAPGDGSVARLIQNNAYGWRCIDSTYTVYGWATYNVRSLDLNEACRLQYGGKAYAVLVQNHARGWVCFR